MAGGRAAARVALKGIAKPLEQLLKVLSRLTEAATSGGDRQAVVDALQKAGRQVFNGWP
jgi:hypothetical protein